MTTKKNIVRLDVNAGRVAAAGDAAAGPLSDAVADRPKSVNVRGARFYREFRKAFNELAEDDARRAYLDTIDRAITSRASDAISWVSLYEAAEFVREQEQFWKQLGFATFEDYWRDRVGEYFSSWHELEATYQYALIACPELFNVDWGEASQKAQLVARLRQIGPASPNGVKRTHSGQYPTKEDASQRVMDASEWKNLGGESFDYRVSKIRRDRPEVFDRMLEGEFFKQTKSGTYTIDVMAAEAAAGLGKTKKKTPKEAQAKGRQLATSVKNQLKQNNTSQRVFIDELLNISWVVKALKARGWVKDA